MATQVRPKDDLYERDFYVWTEAQADLLRARRFEALDLANLIDEVEGLGDTKKSAVLNGARVVMEHLLKLQHSPAQDPRRVWSETIAEHRARIEDGGGVGGGSDLRGKYALKRTRFSCRRFVDNAVQDIQGTVFTALLHCKMTRKRWPEDSSPQLR